MIRDSMNSQYKIQWEIFTVYVCLVVLLACVGVGHRVYAQYSATTSVSLTVCGDAIIAPGEFCDDGINTGVYANTIASRICDPLCSAWGPYCGDGVVQAFYGEECDDGDNTGGDLCDAACQNETDPVTVGGGGGSGNPGGGGGKSGGGTSIDGAVKDGEIEYEGNTDVNVRGRACPGSTITVLRDGDVERVVESDSSSEFTITLVDQTPGITTLGFWVLDKAGRRSVTYSATFQVIQNAVTTLSGVLIPPTVAVSPEQVPYGEAVTFEGCALPATQVQAYLDEGEVPEETIVANNGDWTIVYDTTPLSNESFHTVKANYIDPTNVELKSGFSLITNFYVGTRDVNTNLTADLNYDGYVNLTDFSILLFNWNATGGIADINQDGTVSLADFSIMLFYWTG